MVSQSKRQASPCVRRPATITPKPETVAMRATILAFIQDNPGATIAAICAHVERSRSTVLKYFDELAADQMVHSVLGQRMPHGGRESHFHPGPEPEPEDDGADDSPIQRFVKKWAPNHSRNRFECYLFGIPAAMRGAHA